MYNWELQFCELFERAVLDYRNHQTTFDNYHTAEDRDFLASIGYHTRELFDFVEDFVDSNGYSLPTVLLIAAVRRQYFLSEQCGEQLERNIDSEQLAPFAEQIDGISYLPRIINKAQGKLKGQLDPDVMYGCGGDRRFLNQYKLHPADFLQLVWQLQGDAKAIAASIKP